ncbi:MAG: propionyl-CoA synthetase [Methylobacterium sp. SCN 67-24]|nr:MAG: propionyl-CoA synthetase [Methylobacterium sp. SCN 67-24]
MTASHASRYSETYSAWRRDPEAYWGEIAGGIEWIRPPQRIFDGEAGIYGRWFPDASCNTCFNALDRHVRDGRGEQAALIYDSPVTGTKAAYSYAQMLDEVATLAAVLQEFGVGKGDRVIIYMPMIPEAAFAMLACARIGAVHSVVFGGFAAKELATRIDDAKPKLILTASCGIEPSRIVEYKPLLDGAIDLASHKPQACLVLQRPQAEASMHASRDRNWRAMVGAARANGRKAECVEVAATDPLYVLYTSGTTGKPKGVVRDNGGHMVALLATMGQLYDIRPGEVMFTASDVGWVVGHSYIVYGPLIQGATSILYEGKPVGTPDPGAFWRVISEYKVAAMFTAPTAFRAIRKEDPEAKHLAAYDLSHFRTLFLAGERADPDTLKWAEDVLKVPVVDHWWQTETGSCIVGNPVGLGLLPIKHGSPSVPLPGYDVQCLDEGGRPVAAGTMGAIVLKLPLPPGALPTLWNDDARFRSAYLEAYPGYYNTSDAGFIDEDGYVFIMGRTDDIINVAGHRLSTGGMEEVLASHPAVAECAVVGIKDALKGEQPCGFVVLKAGVTQAPDQVEKELVGLVRDRIGPVAAFKIAITVGRLPKTRSGKILRATMKKIADGEDYAVPATIEDIAVLGEIGVALKGRGLG